MKLYHMSGAGNDFLVCDGRGLTLDYSALAAQLCPQYKTDGFLALEKSEIADFRLLFYNSNGARGEMCGNGARCICRFACELGIAGKAMTVQTDAGIVYGWHMGENQYRVRLNNPSVFDLQRLDHCAYVELGDPGIPHAVKELPGLDWRQKEELLSQARDLRYHNAFPTGANVNFFTRMDESAARILTYERYVEDYTLACGTGSASVAVTLWKQGRLTGDNLTVKNPGGDLEITLETQGDEISALYLTGPAEILNIYDV